MEVDEHAAMRPNINKKDVQLFGGAFACRIPVSFRDISDRVPVPDN